MMATISTTFRLLGAALAASALAACGDQGAPATPDEPAAPTDAAAGLEGAPTDHGSEVGETASAAVLRIENARVRAPLGGRDITAAYFELFNDGEDAIWIVDARADIAERVELHTHQRQGEMMRMVRLDSIGAPGGETMTFQPGGRHLMLFGVSEDLAAGDMAHITLVFDDGQELAFDAGVVEDPTTPTEGDGDGEAEGEDAGHDGHH